MSTSAFSNEQKKQQFFTSREKRISPAKVVYSQQMRSTVPMHKKLDEDGTKMGRRRDEEVREEKAGRQPSRPITTERKLQLQDPISKKWNKMDKAEK